MDIVIDFKILEDQKGAAKPAAKEPPKYQAVYHQPAGMEIECSICLVRDAFRLSFLKAHDGVVAAEKRGKAPVAISTKEIIEERITVANEMLANGKFCSRANFEFIQFTSERAP